MVHDIFISYKRGPDEGRVETLVGALRANGLTVWWDRDIPPNAPWEETIREAIGAATIVLVCWSNAAIASENVRSEARWAKERNRLLQVFVEKCEPPLFFGEHQGLMLLDDADVYGPKFIAVRDAARALITQVGSKPAGADANLSPRDLAQRDQLAREFNYNQPAAAWEAAQFGLTLAIASYVFPMILYFLGVFAFDSETWVFSEVFFFGIGLPFASFIGGLISYGWLARKPRALRVFGVGAVSCVAAAIATIILLAVMAVALPLVSQILASRGQAPDVNNPVEPIMLLAMIALLGAGLYWPFTAIWTIIYLFVLRTNALRVSGVRNIVAAAALILPALASFNGVQAARDGEAQRIRTAKVEMLIRLRGLAPAGSRVFYPGHFPPAFIKDLQRRFKVPVTGYVTSDLEYAVARLPTKKVWILASDGTGDATRLDDIMLRSGGNITIRVRPGIYEASAPPEWSADLPQWTKGGLQYNGTTFMAESGYYDIIPNSLAGALEMRERRVVLDETGGIWYYRVVHIVGEGDPSQIIFEEDKDVYVHNSSSLEGVTVRAKGDGGPPQAAGVFLHRNAQLKNATVLGFVTTSEVEYGAAHEEVKEAYGGEHEFGPIQIVNNTITAGLFLGDKTQSNVSNSHISYANQDPCIIVGAVEMTTIKNNDVSACEAPLGRRIAAALSAKVAIRANAGAADTPKVVPGRDGVAVAAY